ncbi:THAP domain-containing protein 1-like [Vespula pensylvanica]|uniref:THAP domain-containing protein 1-like n=1 Tax=Vespula pensylvanica TaxID=30213 RepID=UPI001CBA2E06|nr:THAP domain-containing protein 1-like [Vespula pensylvanica]
MPTSCSVYGCNNRYSKEKKFQFFTFPFKNEHRLAAWITAVNRKDWKPSKASRICSAHFKPQDFLHRPGTAWYPYIRRLKHDAVPSIFSNYSNHLESSKSELEKEKFVTSVRKESKCSNELKQSFDDPQLYSNGLNKVTLEVENNEEQMEVDFTDLEKDLIIDELQHEIHILKQQINRKDTKIERMKELISRLQDRRIDNFFWKLLKDNRVYILTPQRR